MALRRLGERFEITTTRPLGYDRPWRRPVAPESDAPVPPRAMPPQPRDATPREDDLEAGGCGRGPGAMEPARGGGLIAPEQPDQLSLDAYAIGRQDSDLVGGIGGLERNRGAAAAETLERRLFFVDQRHHDIARIGPIGLLEQRDIAVEDASLDHAITTHLEREVLPGRKYIGGHVDDVAFGLDRLDRRTGGDAAHDRHRDRTPAFVLRCGAPPAKVALDHARSESARATRADAVRNRLRQLDHLDGAGTIGQAANEAALLQRRDEPMDPGFRAQIERVLHLVEGRRHSGLL